LQGSDFLSKYGQYTKEVNEARTRQVVHLLYRLSAKEVARIREEAPRSSASTLQRRLQEFTQERPQFEKDSLSLLDG